MVARRQDRWIKVHRERRLRTIEMGQQVLLRIGPSDLPSIPGGSNHIKCLGWTERHPFEALWIFWFRADLMLEFTVLEDFFLVVVVFGHEIVLLEHISDHVRLQRHFGLDELFCFLKFKDGNVFFGFYFGGALFYLLDQRCPRWFLSLLLVVFLLPLEFLLCLQWRNVLNLAIIHRNGYFRHVFGLREFVLLLGLLLDFALFIFFDSAHFVVLMTIWAFPLSLFDLEMVTLITNLVLAITGIEFLLVLLEVILAHVADIWPSSQRFLRWGVVKILLLVQLLLSWLGLFRFGSILSILLCWIRLLMITHGRLIIWLLVIVVLRPLLMLHQIILLMVIIVFTVILMLGSRILNLLTISANSALLVLRRTRIAVILVLVVILRVRVLLVPRIIVVLGRSGSCVWFLVLVLSTMVEVVIALFPAIKFWWIGVELLILSRKSWRWPNRSRRMAMIDLLLGLLPRRKLVTILFSLLLLLFTTRCIVLLFEPSVLLHP